MKKLDSILTKDMHTGSFCARASAEKISRGGGGNGKKQGQNSTIKPSSTLSVPCMKIQGRHCPQLPTPMILCWSGITDTEHICS